MNIRFEIRKMLLIFVDHPDLGSRFKVRTLNVTRGVATKGKNFLMLDSKSAKFSVAPTHLDTLSCLRAEWLPNVSDLFMLPPGLVL